MDDSAKHRVEGYIKLAEYWAGRYEGRRQFEWKITLAWWGLIILGVRYVHPKFLQTLPGREYVMLSVSLAAFLLFCFIKLWLYPLWRANARDKEKSFAAAYGAQTILLDPYAAGGLITNDKVDVSTRLFTKDWSMRFQALTTLLLLTVLCISARY